MRHFSGTHTFLSKYVRSTHGHVNAHETHLLNNNKIRTLLTLIKQLDAYGSNPAIIPIQEGVCNYISYAELAEKVAQLSSGLVQTGICSGDHVALLARNSDEWIIACLATIKAGAVVVYNLLRKHYSALLTPTVSAASLQPLTTSID